jgi:hypothetical protein
MLFLRLVLFIIAIAFLTSAAAMVAYDIFLALELDRLLRPREAPAEPPSTDISRTGEPGQSSEPAVPLRAGGRVRAPFHRRRRIVLDERRWKTALKFVAIAAGCALAGESVASVSLISFASSASPILIFPARPARPARRGWFSGVTPAKTLAGGFFRRTRQKLACQRCCGNPDDPQSERLLDAPFEATLPVEPNSCIA